MAYAYLPLVLRITKGLTGFFLVMAAILTLSLCFKIAEAASQSEVRLALDTRRPNVFGAWQEMQGGLRGQHRCERGPLSTVPTVGFDVQANPDAQLLRYREPSDSKRMILQALGALDDSLSVAGLLFLSYGSWLLLKLLCDVTPATPFTLANAQRLRKLTLLIVGLNVWQYVAYLLVRVLVPAYHTASLAYPLSHYVRLNTESLVPDLSAGFILAIITAVYQRGVELSREAELVI